MKILTISSTTWDNSNSFGNTFSNLFGGMENVEIYNIACRNGVSNNNVTAKEIQMTDKSVFKSILKLNYDPCWEIVQNQNIDEVNSVMSVNAIKKRRTISFIIRDLIWKIGRWKKSKVLNEFLKQHKPDVVYLPIYATPYMCDIQQYIIDKLNVPVVGHISDDVYNMPPNLSFVAKKYRKYLQKKITKIIKSCKYLEVFAQNMADEYSEQFEVPCYLIGKGVTEEEINTIPLHEPKNKDILKIIYTGNISAERFSVLSSLGKTIDTHFSNKAVIDIYTQTYLSKEMEEEFASINSIELKGAVDSTEVKNIQKSADLLLHIEGFSEKSLFEVKMSFSTKIIDYMLTGVPILAIGPRQANSIMVLEKDNLATVITDSQEMRDVLEQLFNKEIDVAEQSDNIVSFLKRERNIKFIQEGIYNRLKAL